jgi:hypothetical protein
VSSISTLLKQARRATIRTLNVILTAACWKVGRRSDGCGPFPSLLFQRLPAPRDLIPVEGLSEPADVILSNGQDKQIKCSIQSEERKSA